MHVHTEQRVLPYTPEQLFGLVIDVAKYPEFLPWCLAARIRKRTDSVMIADLVVGYKMIRERFTSRVAFDAAAGRIDVDYIEGPVRHLTNRWLFHAQPEGCLVDFYVEFEFSSRILERLMEPLFDKATRRMISAFEARAADLFGTP